jgi:F-type H+-transporting ATPase subunit a
MSIDASGAKYFLVDLFGYDVKISGTTVTGWILIVVITALCLFLTRSLKKVPETKSQVVAEMVVNTVNDLVKTNLGDYAKIFGPYIASLFIYSFLGSTISMIGFKSMTADYNTILGWVLINFLIIQVSMFIIGRGPWGYFKKLNSPVPGIMIPMNILGFITTPLSMSLRHFANVAGGGIIGALIYGGLQSVGGRMATIGVPAAVSAYFDVFAGFIQAFIFIMLTMCAISSALEKDA